MCSRVVSVAKAKRVEVNRSVRSMAAGQSGMKMVEAWYFVVGAIGTYIITSVFFLKWPILYKKKRLSFQCAHISHRGGAAEKPENTREAYRNALQCGTQMLELDVHLTADKVIVVSHDDHLERTTGEDVSIKNTRYEDLPLLQNDLSVTFQYGTICHNPGDRLGIEKLEDVFEEFRNVPIHLDVKTYDEELIDMVNSMIKKYDRESITPWGNFSDKVTTKLYKTNPDIPLTFSVTRVATTLLTFYIGLLPFLPIKESSLAILMPSTLKKAFGPSFAGSRRMRILASVLDFLLMSRVLFSHLKARGINVYLWVLNDEEDFKRAFKLGVTGVMTDNPSKLREWLDANPKYKTDD